MVKGWDFLEGMEWERGNLSEINNGALSER